MVSNLEKVEIHINHMSTYVLCHFTYKYQAMPWYSPMFQPIAIHLYFTHKPSYQERFCPKSDYLHQLKEKNLC